MTATSADATLVTRYLAGDRNALAALYDRFAPSLYDTAAAMLSDRDEAADVVQDTFLVAAERMGQLRDPERIKAWLFAIARHEIYRRTKRRRRVTPSEWVPEMAAPVDVHAEAELASYEELAALVRDATAGLDERDRLVLELSVRQGLQGADLAAALGVTPEQSYTLVHRMRERVERTIGALVVARLGRKDCPELSEVLTGWDGTFSVLVRKRVARHVDSCETCERSRRKLAPLALIGSAPAFALPPSLREQVLTKVAASGGGRSRRYRFDADGGFPGAARMARRTLLLLGGAAILLIALIGGLAAADKLGDSSVQVNAGAPSTDAPTTTAAPVTVVTAAETAPATLAPTAPVTLAPTATPTTASPPTTTTAPTTTVPPTTTIPAAPGELTLSSALIDLGRSTTSAQVSLKNTGGRSFQWTRSGASPFTISGPASGTLTPGQEANLSVAVNRSNLAEGSYSKVLSIGGDFPAQVTVKARVERRPVVDIVAIDDTISSTCTTSIISVEASITDESGIDSVKGTWSGPAGTGSFAMVFNGNWYGSIPMSGGFGQGNGGTYSLTVTATDTRGNTGSDTGKFFVSTCPG